MKAALLLASILFVSCASTARAVAPGDSSTPTGIALDAPWKQKLYAFAQAHLLHPSWGLTHSERDYRLAERIANAEKIEFDPDILFAAAFLHDQGGLPPFEKKGVDHAVRSSELAAEKLPEFGFPSQKIAQVQDIILAHTYYTPAPSNASAIALAFRDADILDFLGTMGAARVFGATRDLDPNFSSLTPAYSLIKKFQTDMPPKLTYKASKAFATPKLEQLKVFLESLYKESEGERAI